MWVVTNDLFEGKKVNVMSSDFDSEVWATRPHFKFRMLDDDGEVYYEGESDDSDSEEAFAPLDDYGMPNVGCTSIQFWEKGKWETL